METGTRSSLLVYHYLVSKKRRNNIPIQISWSETTEYQPIHFERWFSIKTIRKWAWSTRFFSRYKPTWIENTFGFYEKCFFFCSTTDGLFNRCSSEMKITSDENERKSRRPTRWNRSLWLKSCVNGVQKSTDFQFHFMFIFLLWEEKPTWKPIEFQSKSWTKVEWKRRITLFAYDEWVMCTIYYSCVSDRKGTVCVFFTYAYTPTPTYTQIKSKIAWPNQFKV